jgi:hypothetical protein
MRNVLKIKGREVTWPKALLLICLWFFPASAVLAVFMTILFGSHALWRIYYLNNRGALPLLGYWIFGAWIFVIGHFITMIAAAVVHKSWKIIFLYIGIPVLVGILFFLWLNASIGKMMAAFI